MNWLARAREEFAKTDTAVTAERNLTAVLAVPESDLFRLQTSDKEAGGHWFIAGRMEKSEHWFSPPVTFEELRLRFPDAVLVRLTEHKRSFVPSDQTDELKSLVKSVSTAMAFTDGETREAMNSALADPVNALVCFRVLQWHL